MGQELDSPKQQEQAQEPLQTQDDGLQAAASALTGLMGEGDDLPPHDLDAEAAQATTEKPVQEQPQKTDDTKAPVEDKAQAIAFKIGDKEYSIPAENIPEELRDVVKDGILMRADYTRKVQEVAEQRKAAEARVQQVDQAMQAVSQFPDHLAAIRTVEAQLQQFQNPELWQRLAMEDPSGIRTIQAKQAIQDLANQRQALYGELDRAHGQAQQLAQSQFHERMQAALPKVKESIPDFSETKVKEMREFAKQFGATDAQLNTIYDAAPLVILDMALKYHKLQSQSVQTTAKVEKLPPKVVRSGTSSGPQGPNVNQAAMQRLQRNGKVEDAASVISSLLE